MEIIPHPAVTRPYIVKTISGLEEVLAEELAEIGAANIEILKRAVSFEGDTRMLYKANYCLRTAQRILMPLYSFDFKGEDGLYEAIHSFEWEKYLSLQKTLAVDAVVTDSELTHSHFVALRTKDAIVDRFRELNNGRRPSVDTENPHIRINIHINGDVCDVSLDSSGASLHKRGYRVSNAEAPISEVLAAGLIRLSGWQRDCPFIDPMCGSGTLVIEAAMYANNFPAGMYRKEFGFMHWPDFDEKLWGEVTTEALEQQTEFEHPIIGSDISPKNLASARSNLKSAKLHKDVKIFISPFEALQRPAGPNGIIIMNPPYGERIRLNDIVGLYRSIGDILKQQFSGYQAWVISSDQKALSFIGLRPTGKFTVFNGQLECRYVHFDLYKGSKRGRYMENEETTKDINERPQKQHFEPKPVSEYKTRQFSPREQKPFEKENDRTKREEKRGFKQEEDSKRKPFFDKKGDYVKQDEKRGYNRDGEYKRKPFDGKDDAENKKPFERKPRSFDKEKRPFKRDDAKGEKKPWFKDESLTKKTYDRPAKAATRIEDLNDIKPKPENAEMRTPSAESKFSSFKDYVPTRPVKLRSRKEKQPHPPKKQPKPPVNFDDMED